MSKPVLTLEAEIRQIVDDALNSAIPEPWEVSAHAAKRILELIERLRSPVFGTPTALEAADAIETWKARAERLADMHRDMCVVAGEATARAETAEATISVLLRRLAEVEKAEPASRLRAVSQP